MLEKLYNAIKGPGLEKTALFVFHRFFYEKYRHKSNHGVNIFSWPKSWQSCLLDDYTELDFCNLNLLIIFGWLRRFNLERYFLKKYIYYCKIFIKEFNLSESILKRLFIMKFYNFDLRIKFTNINEGVWRVLNDTLFKEISDIFNILEKELKILDPSFFKNINKSLKHNRKKIFRSEWPFLVCYLQYQEALIIDEILNYFNNEYVIPLNRGILLPSKVLTKYVDWEIEIKKKIQLQFNFLLGIVKKSITKPVKEDIVIDPKILDSLRDIQNIFHSKGDGKQWYYYKTLASGKIKRISKFIFNELKKANCLEIKHIPIKLPIPNNEELYYVYDYSHADPKTITNLWKTNNYYFQKQHGGKTKRITKGAYRLLEMGEKAFAYVRSNKKKLVFCSHKNCREVAEYSLPYFNIKLKDKTLFCKKHFNFFEQVLEENKKKRKINKNEDKIIKYLSVGINYIFITRKGYFFICLKNGNKKRINKVEYNILLEFDIKVLYSIKTCNAILDSGLKCSKYITHLKGYLCSTHECKRKSLTINDSVVIKNNFKYLPKIYYWDSCYNIEYFLWQKFVSEIKNIF